MVIHAQSDVSDVTFHNFLIRVCIEKLGILASLASLTTASTPESHELANALASSEVVR